MEGASERASTSSTSGCSASVSMLRTSAAVSRAAAAAGPSPAAQPAAGEHEPLQNTACVSSH
jgi:hypothetical protein